MEKFKFIKEIERLISPIDIATLQNVAPFNKLLPTSIQNKMMHNSAKVSPYMGFVVEPYSFFLCYEIIDLKLAQSMLSDGFEMIKTSIFDEEPKYYCIFTCYNIHSSAFWGTRLEVNLIAKNLENNLTSWVILDYDTDALSHDKANGLRTCTTSEAILTTDFDGNIIVDIRNQASKRELVVNANTTSAIKKVLDQQLWLDGNLSIGYGKTLSNNSSDVFSLKFDAKEVTYGYEIALENVSIDINTWFPGLFKQEVEHVVFFPFAQHFLSDSPGYSSNINSKEEMVQQYNNLDLDNLPNYSAKKLRTMFKISLFINLIISWTLIFIILVLLF